MLDIYAAVTDRIIAELEKGRIPWIRPWTGARVSAGTADCAYSRSTGRAYSLINQILLGKPGEYLTFNQCKEAGGRIRKSEKASMVVFWKPLPVTEKNPITGEDETRTVPFLRYYNVFHIDQCEGIEPKVLPQDVQPFDPDEEAERITSDYLQRSGVHLSHVRGNRAFYSPSGDLVQLPLVEQFNGKAEYYGTLFHELTHSTGHASRLNRLDKLAAFGSDNYSKEELVAEIGSAAIVHHLGLETNSSFRNSAAYIQSWIKALRNDKRLIVSAAGKAEKAVALILNL